MRSLSTTARLLVVVALAVACCWSVDRCRGDERYSPQPGGDYLFFENFQDVDTLASSRWLASSHPEYLGRWNLSGALEPELDGAADARERSLVVRDVARKHAISAALPQPIRCAPDADFVLQLEVRTQHYLECGGAYIKLLRAHDDDDDDDSGDQRFDPASFSNAQPYAIMFGPDKCGGDVKLHFIFQRQNPVSKQWEEKALRPFPPFPVDTVSHLYTLHLHTADNTYEVLVDGVPSAEGSLYEDFEPPVNPPELIDDPADHKPADWVDDAEVPDPHATKPDDWDETAPLWIDDPDDHKPADWLDDAAQLVPDPAATKPSEWDDELDGDWEPSLVPNPLCQQFGCGPWRPRQITNPAYKGPWSPPLIANPAYVGPWRARQIPNPHWFEDKQPACFPDIVGVGFELWTMTNWISFDNVLITRSRRVADEFAQRTFFPRHAREKALSDQHQASLRANAEPGVLDELASLLDDVHYAANENPAAFFAIVAVASLVPLLLVVCCCCSSSDDASRPRPRPRPSSPPSTTTPAPSQ